MNNMYAQFETDPQLERSGIWVDYGSFRVLLARTGGANKAFLRTLEARTKPYRRAIQTETADKDQMATIMREVFAATVVLGWEVNQGTAEEPSWTPGLHTPEGGIAPFEQESVLQALKALPDLYEDLQLQASKSALYRREILEADAKN